jgi:hypothetical protein
MNRRLLAISCLLALMSPLPAAAQRTIIEGVPRMDWSTKKWSLHISALYAALQPMGCPRTYEEFMVTSGAAFRTAWWPGRYSYAAPELTPEDLALNGANAVGAILERHQLGAPEDGWAFICESIDSGRPVIGWANWGARVICGYDPQGQRMYVRQYQNASEEYAVIPFETPGAPWPLSRPNEIAMLDYHADQPIPGLDWIDILERAIRFADWPAEENLYDKFAFGLGAYDSWAQTLRDGADASGPETDAAIAEWTARVYSDARRAASVVLQANAEVHQAFAEAAARYTEEAELLDGMLGVLSGGQGGTWAELRQAMAAHFADEAVREWAALLVEQAKEKEMQAVHALRIALADLSKQSPTPAAGGDGGG